MSTESRPVEPLSPRAQSSNGDYRIESFPDDNQPDARNQRVVDAATGVIVFDTRPLKSSTLMEFDVADLVVLYLACSSKADIYLIDPPRRAYRALYDPCWLRLDDLKEREKSWFQYNEKGSAATRHRVATDLAGRAGRSILSNPDKIGPGAPFPAVSPPYRPLPIRYALSPTGRYRVETMTYLPNDGRFGDGPEEYQQLIEVSTNVVVLDSLALGVHVTMTFVTGGLIQLQVPAFGTSREYLLDPEGRLFTRVAVLESWLPFTDLREVDQACHGTREACRMTGRGFQLFELFAWIILGILILAGFAYHLS